MHGALKALPRPKQINPRHINYKPMTSNLYVLSKALLNHCIEFQDTRLKARHLFKAQTLWVSNANNKLHRRSNAHNSLADRRLAWEIGGMRLHNVGFIHSSVAFEVIVCGVQKQTKTAGLRYSRLGIPEHRDTAEHTSSQEVYVETPIGLRQVYGRWRKCDHGIIMFFVCCLGQFKSVFHFLFPLLLLNSMSSSLSLIALSLDLQQAGTGFQRE